MRITKKNQQQTNKQTKQERVTKIVLQKFTNYKNYQLFVHYVVAADFAIFYSRMGAST